MLGFWEKRIRNTAVARLAIVPFLNEAASLCMAASRLVPFREGKQANGLRHTGAVLNHHAAHVRRCGLAWAANESKFGDDAAGLLSGFSYERYYHNEAHAPAPDAVPYLVAFACALLRFCVPMAQKLEALDWQERGSRIWLEGRLEDVSGTAGFSVLPDIGQDALNVLGRRAILLECEGLACTQARIEDSFAQFSGTPRARKKSGMTDAEIRKLASETGADFSALKDVLESAFSSWWQRADTYRREAEALQQPFLVQLSAQEGAALAVRSAWDAGTPSAWTSSRCYGNKELEKSEAVITMLLGLFLLWRDELSSPGCLRSPRGTPRLAHDMPQLPSRAPR